MDPLTLFGVDVVLFFLIGLLAGAHCIGMCGPLVTIYSNRMEPDDGVGTDGGVVTNSGRGHLTPYAVRQHTLFNLGRTASYTLIGAAFGALGGVVFVTTEQLTPLVDVLRGALGLLVGGFVIVTGVYYVFGRTTGGFSVPGASRVTGLLTGYVDRLAKGPGIVGLGALHGLLPCPVLYPAFLYAFVIGSPTGGALALLALGLGTIPAVFAYGTLLESVNVTQQRRVHRLLGVAFIVLGYALFAHGLLELGIDLPHPHLPFYDGIDVPGVDTGHDH